MRRETPAPPGSTRYPALAAIALTSLMVGSIWWLSSDEEAQEVVAIASEPASRATAPTPRKLTDQVLAFAEFAKGDLPDAPSTRAATASGLRLLAAAMAARGDSTLWRDRATRLEEAAAKVEGAADSTRAAAEVRLAFEQAAEWVAGLPRVSAGRDALRTSAESIEPGQPLKDQSDRVEAFFGTAARALEGSVATSPDRLTSSRA